MQERCNGIGMTIHLNLRKIARAGVIRTIKTDNIILLYAKNLGYFAININKNNTIVLQIRLAQSGQDFLYIT